MIFENIIKSIHCSSLSKKNLSAVKETQAQSLGWEDALEEGQVFLPGESHRQRSLVGYSPWGSPRVGHKAVTNTTTTITTQGISTSCQLCFFFQWQLLLSLLLVFIFSPYRMISPSNFRVWKLSSLMIYHDICGKYFVSGSFKPLQMLAGKKMSGSR